MRYKPGLMYYKCFHEPTVSRWTKCVRAVENVNNLTDGARLRVIRRLVNAPQVRLNVMFLGDISRALALHHFKRTMQWR